MSDFTKTVRIGTGDNGNVYCKISLHDGRLSISGVEGPQRNGDCRGACGQIVMHDWQISNYAPGWNAETVRKFREVWDRWHLNDMRAGSPAQSEFLRQNPIADRLNYYTAACDALAAAGLNPDPNYLHNGKPYKYGHAWLRDEVPQEVIDWLRALPDTDQTPAWI